MTSACIFVKSDNHETYRAIFEQLQLQEPKLEEVVWCYYEIEKNAELVKDVAVEIDRRHLVIRDPKQVEDLIRKYRIFDITALPKPDMTEVLSIFVGRPSLSVFTLNRSEKEPYINLMNGPVLKSYARWYAYNRLIVRYSLLTIAIGIVGFGILTITEFIPNSQEFTSWLGITVGLLSLGIPLARKFLG